MHARRVQDIVGTSPTATAPTTAAGSIAITAIAAVIPVERGVVERIVERLFGVVAAAAPPIPHSAAFAVAREHHGIGLPALRCEGGSSS